MRMIDRLIIVLLLTTSISTFGQSKEQIIKEYVDSFNKRDIDRYMRLFDDSAKMIKFPNMISEKSKSEIRKSYSTAFNSNQLGGEIEILGKTEINEIYIIEQSLKFDNANPIEQYLLFKFKGDKIIEIQFLPKHFSWIDSGSPDK